MINPAYAQTLFNFLYNDIDGYSVSRAARNKHTENTEDLLYGEITFDCWQKIIAKADPKKDGVFFDLGSGTGKAVILSHLAYDFKKIVGVELLQGLHDKACEIKENFDTTIKPQILEHTKDRELQFIQKDLFDVDISEADLVFLNYPFKNREMFTRLENKLLTELKPGSKIVMIIKIFENKALKSLGSQKLQFGWGEATAHFYEV